ncbi:alpha/beta fold hydrolase [Streptomyces chartreusis]|uniref:alpha/beta fold hydrolase n=1 Tax=Streptomyces chartreusis TaxID=1969 RepID=UPI003629BFA6
MNGPVMISVRGRATRIRDAGYRDGTPVLLLHGIGRSLEDWAPLYPRLAGMHRLISLDLPGSGFSARAAEPTTLEVLAQAALDTLDAVGEHRPVLLVGNSLGGAVALRAAVQRPAGVAGLCLVNSAGFGAEAALALRLMALPGIGDLALRRPTRTSARRVERLTFADPRWATEARVEHALAIARQPDTAAVMLETLRALATFRGVRSRWRGELLRAAAKHRHPTLVVWGDRDRVLPPSHLAAAKAALPHAETEMFVGIGHMPQIECPDEFATRLLTFLGTVEPAAAVSRWPAEPGGKRGVAVGTEHVEVGKERDLA